MLPVTETISKIITVSLLLTLLSVATARGEESGIITAYKLNVRSGPDRTASTITVLDKGTRVRIIKHVGEWLEIFHDGQTGFIRNRERYVHIVTKGGDGKADTRNEESIRTESKEIRREIEKRQEDVKAFDQEEITLISGLNEIDLSLHNARKRSAEFLSDLEAVDGQIKETSQTVQTLLKSIETTESCVAKRLVALYKLNSMGRLQFLASAGSMYDFFLRKTSLERILAYDQAVQNSLLEKKALLARLLDRLNTKKAEQVSLQEKYEHQVQFMSKERSKRQQLLAEIQSRKSLELAAIESLRQAAEALDKTIRSLVKPAPGANKKPLQKSFSALKGLMQMPVKGAVVTAFGTFRNPKFNTLGFRSGIHIKADKGEPIRAVFDGRIAYSNWFKGFGNMIIIDHGNGYYTVYAHAEELFKSEGDTVEAQEVIATVGDSGSLVGPRLYFEVRHHGKPMDPLQWVGHG